MATQIFNNVTGTAKSTVARAVMIIWIFVLVICPIAGSAGWPIKHDKDKGHYRPDYHTNVGFWTGVALFTTAAWILASRTVPGEKGVYTTNFAMLSIAYLLFVCLIVTLIALENQVADNQETPCDEAKQGEQCHTSQPFKLFPTALACTMATAIVAVLTYNCDKTAGALMTPAVIWCCYLASVHGIGYPVGIMARSMSPSVVYN